MRDGDLFAKQFGGSTGDDPDFFKLSVYGIGEDGEALGVEVDFYLADYRFNDNSQDYILDTWELLDLSTLADARSLHFNLSSSDVGDFGMNTPAYFAIDSLFFQTPPSSNPILDAGEDADDGAPDTFVVDVDGPDLIVTANGMEVLRQPLADITSLTLNGSNDDDSFTIDQNNDLIDIPITINGGSHITGDTLTIDGGTFDALTLNHDDLTNGSLQLDSAIVAFHGIEPLEVLGSNIASLVVNLTDSVDVTHFSITNTSLNIDNSSNSHGNDTLNLDGVTSITINAGADADTITFQDIATSEYTGTWNIDGGTGTDRYEILATATVELSTDFLLAEGEQLHVDGELHLPAMGTLTLSDLSMLSGRGRLRGNVVAAGNGKVSPGEQSGQLTIDGNFNLSGGDVAIVLGGTTAGTEYDQIVVTAAATEINLDGATLSRGLEFAPLSGDVFTILDNQSSQPITGTFNDLPEGTEFELQNPVQQITRTVRISYIGGDGNDVTLTILEPMGPPAETDVVLAGGQLTITDVNGGDSDDTLSFSIVDDNLRVTDPANTLHGTGTGVVRIDEHTMEVPLANITAGIVIDTQAGTDQVIFATAFDLADNSLAVTTDEFVLDDSLTTSGPVNLQANVTVNQPVAVSASALVFGNSVSGNGPTAVTLITDALEIGGIFTNVIPTVQPLSPGTSIGLGGATGVLNLTDAEIAHLGSLGVTIGDNINTTTITLDTVTVAGVSEVTLIGAEIIGSDGVDLTTSGDVQLIGNLVPDGEFSVDAASVSFDESASGITVDISNTGTPTVDYDQLQFLGNNRLVNWNDVSLTIQFAPSYIPTDGDEFTIVDLADTASSSVGHLNGLAEGDSIVFDGFETRISYGGGDGNDVTLTVHILNQPPIITAPMVQNIDEDASLVFSNFNNNRIALSDPDATSNEVGLTLAVTNGSLSWGELSGLTIEVTDTIENLNRQLDGLVFRPDADYFGSAVLTISVDDLGHTGGGGSQTAMTTIDLIIAPVNDSPINTVPSSQTVNFLSDLVFSNATSNSISVSDPDIGTGNEPVEVTLSVNGGTLTLSTTNGLTLTTGDGIADSTLRFRGSLAHVNTALDGLTYRSNADFFGEDILTFTTNDLAHIGNQPLTDTDSISIAVAEPIIDSPLSQFEETPISTSLINGDFTNIVSGNFDDNSPNLDLLDDLFLWNPTTGANRLVLGDGSTRDNVIDPTFVNGNDFFEVIAANLDDSGLDDLLFWNPTTGQNRLAHLKNDDQLTVNIELDVIDRTFVNGNDFTTIVAGDLNAAGPDDLFFWHPMTGANRLIHLSAAAAGVDTDVVRVENDVIPRQIINRNDFQQIGIGEFVAGGVAELMFLSLKTGANRLVELTIITPGQDTRFKQVTTNAVSPPLLNSNIYTRTTFGDFDNNGFSDVFVWNPVTGENRLLLTGETTVVVDQPISPSVINGDMFNTATPRSSVTDLGFETTGLFFWDSITGQNRLLM